MSGRRSSRRRRALVPALAAILLVGCATLPPREPLPPEALRLLDLLQTRRRDFEDLRTLAEVTIRHDGRARRLSGILVLRAPASLRFEALSPWGQPFLLLAGDGETVTLWDVPENRALVGPASAAATERWLGFPLEAADLVGLLAGHVLPLHDPLRGEVLPADGLGPSLKLTGAAGTQRIWLDPRTGVVRQVEWTETRRPARVTYEGGGVHEPPAALTLVALGAPLTVTIRYQEPRVGTAPGSELFTIRLPEHVRIDRFR